MMDARLRQQIVHEIGAFDATVASLRHLVANLDAVWSTESWDEETRREFRRQWSKLEEVYATAVERNPPAYGDRQSEGSLGA
jgi:hypothetical protein